MSEWDSIDVGNLFSLHNVNSNTNSTSFDPYQSILNRQKNNNDIKAIDDDPIKSYDEEDLIALENFCRKHNILGFNCGTMSPRAALTFLKRKMGVRESDISKRQVLNG